MGTKQSDQKVSKSEEKRKAVQQKPKSIEGRRQTVEKKQEKSFEERTQAQQPWLSEDGKQVNQ